MRTLICLVLLVLVSVAGCQDAAPTKWQGQGLTFNQAADRAVREYFSSYLNTLIGKRSPYAPVVCFYWDNQGTQERGCVNVFQFGWVEPPHSASEQPSVHYLDEYYQDAQSTFAPLGWGTDCWMWPSRCYIVGWDWTCGRIGGCPIYECVDGCPPEAYNTPE